MPIGKRIDDAERKDLKGLPLSQWDLKNIAYLISFFEKAYPGVISRVAREARQDIIKDRKLKAAEDSSHKLNYARRMAIPNGLLQELKRGYPAIIVDNRQFEQFLKAFPQFDLYQ